jgi:hypothetical protein
LIIITKKSQAKRKNIGLGGGFDRATTAGHYLFFSQYKDDRSRLTLFDDINNNGNNNILVKDEHFNEEFGGMPMVVIESREIERQER